MHFIGYLPALGQASKNRMQGKYESLTKNFVTQPWISKNAETMYDPNNSFKITLIFWEKSNICMIWNTTKHTGLKSEEKLQVHLPHIPIVVVS